MKKLFNLLLVFVGIICLVSCHSHEWVEDKTKRITPTYEETGMAYYSCKECGETKEEVLEKLHDYVADCKLNLNNGKPHNEVTVSSFIDGDTTHFNTTDPTFAADYYKIKARYAGIDTPESTGQVQPYGKAASNFTKQALTNATSIIVEPEETTWKHDSTGSRYMCWVWYKNPSISDDYRLLNLELLQNGYTAAKNYSSLTYGSYMSNAYTQALNYGIRCCGNTPDPDYYYGSSINVTLSELRRNSADYEGRKVRFEGIYITGYNNTHYFYYHDDVSGLNFGYQAFDGYNDYPYFVKGNKVSLSGTVSYYENGGTYQVAGFKYSIYGRGEDNMQLISQGNEIEYQLISASDLDGTTTVDVNYQEYDETIQDTITKTQTCIKSLTLLYTPVRMTDLEVVDIYTTKKGDNTGAMTLTCEDEFGNEVSVRTIVLFDANGAMITEDAYLGKTINVKGIVDYYKNDSDQNNGSGYQIKVLSRNDITIVE